MGVAFRSDVGGYIAGIRFYKNSANTGTHVGSLWGSSETLLATATFTSETSSGWQQVNFSQPVAITANTVYVASYHSTGGHYSADWDYFLTFRRGQCSSACAGRQNRRSERGICIWQHQCFPGEYTPVRELLGGCGVQQ
ncbi:MAG: hypothetical protein AUF67_10465 [Acidobacteria bacterium 13_1_20CM_58_21]|nr:MAG: hypothetical protein AUF67_10465 [Acidobacteria bacterium 13_1_20CM_58_21]